MIIGLRTAAWQKRGYTARDYVQNGLVAIYDAIENAGWGVHDSVSCLNLIADKWHGQVGANVVISENAFIFSGVKGISYAIDLGDEWFGKPDHLTAEVLFYSDGVGSQTEQGVFGGVESPLLGFSFLSNRVIAGWDGMTTAAASQQWSYPSWIATGKTQLKSFVVGADLSGSYTNGVADIQTSPYINPKSGGAMIWSGNAKHAFIGCDAYNPTEYHLKGGVHCARVYNRALTPAEIAANYAIDKARFNVTV